jgi:hypothetical protein
MRQSKITIPSIPTVSHLKQCHAHFRAYPRDILVLFLTGLGTS